MTPDQKQLAEFVIFVALTIGSVVWNRIQGNKRLDELEAALIDRIEGKSEEKPT